jgi:hypothetical protein
MFALCLWIQSIRQLWVIRKYNLVSCCPFCRSKSHGLATLSAAAGG